MSLDFGTGASVTLANACPMPRGRSGMLICTSEMMVMCTLDCTFARRLAVLLAILWALVARDTAAFIILALVLGAYQWTM